MIAAAAMLALVTAPLAAADLLNVLTGYSLTSWGQKDGLPPSVIWAISQDREGYLWLGTDAGPMRFDGVRFLLWQSQGPTRLPEAPVRAICASRDGSIWLGFGEPGGVSRLKDGAIQNFGPGDGLALGVITMLVEEPDGTIWAGNRAGLYTFVNERWQSVGQGLPTSVIYSTLADRSGRRLVATADGVFQREPDQSSFRRLEGFQGAVRGIVQDPLGRVWVADPIVGFSGLEGRRGRSADRGNGSSLFHDSKGNLWVGTFGQGLWRVRSEPAFLECRRSPETA